MRSKTWMNANRCLAWFRSTQRVNRCNDVLRPGECLLHEKFNWCTAAPTIKRIDELRIGTSWTAITLRELIAFEHRDEEDEESP